jgi:hypothetical protein
VQSSKHISAKQQTYQCKAANKTVQFDGWCELTVGAVRPLAQFGAWHNSTVGTMRRWAHFDGGHNSTVGKIRRLVQRDICCKQNTANKAKQGKTKQSKAKQYVSHGGHVDPFRLPLWR